MTAQREQDRITVLTQLLWGFCRVKRAVGRHSQKRKKKKGRQEPHTNRPEEHVQGSSAGFRWLGTQFGQISIKRVQNLVMPCVVWTPLSRLRRKAYWIIRPEGEIEALRQAASWRHRRKLDRAGQKPWGCLLWHLKVWGDRNLAWLRILWGVSLSW